MCNWRFPSFPSSELNLNFEFLENILFYFLLQINHNIFVNAFIYILIRNKNSTITKLNPAYHPFIGILKSLHVFIQLLFYQIFKPLIHFWQLVKRKENYLSIGLSFYILSSYLTFRFLLICTHTRTHGSWKYLQRKLAVASSHRQRKRLPKA